MSAARELAGLELREVRDESVAIEQSANYGILVDYTNDGPEANLIRDSQILRNGAAGVLQAGGLGGVAALFTGNVVWGNEDEGVDGGNMVITHGAFGRNGDEGVLGDSGVGEYSFVANNGGIGQPQTAGIVQIAPNFCDGDTTCP